MTAKSLDKKNRWRCKTVSFRVSPEEDEHLEKLVRLSGLTKQDYILKRLQNKDIVVVGNPRVHKALRNELEDVLRALRRIEAGEKVDSELLEIIAVIVDVMGDLKEESQ